LHWWGRFESFRALSWQEKDSAFVRGDFTVTGVTVPVVHVEGEEPLTSDSKSLESGALEPSC
jgi:hypothetical protein